MAPEQFEIRELKKRIERIELENEILKKTTALLMIDLNRILRTGIEVVDVSEYRSHNTSFTLQPYLYNSLLFPKPLIHAQTSIHFFRPIVGIVTRLKSQIPYTGQ